MFEEQDLADQSFEDYEFYNQDRKLSGPVQVETETVGTQTTPQLERHRRNQKSMDLSKQRSHGNLLTVEDLADGFQTARAEVKRKDAIEEFFRMTVLGLKIAHQDLDAVCQIKPQELYLKAKMLKIEFQHFHEYIETEINSQFLRSLYLNTDPSTEADDFVPEPRPEERQGIFSRIKGKFN